MIVNFEVFPDETKLIYSDSNALGAFSVKLHDLHTHEEIELFKDLNNPYSVQGSKTDRIIFHSDGSCYVFDLKSKELNLIYSSQDQLRSCFGTLSPNGEWASYVVSSRQPPFIEVIDLKTKTIHSIKDEDSGSRFPYWSSSNRYIAYTNQKLKDGTKKRWIHIYDVKNQTRIELPKAFDAKGIINSNCWSKDQERLVYLEETETSKVVRLYDLKTKKVTRVIEDQDLCEVGFYDTNTLLLISSNSLTKYHMNTRTRTTVRLKDGEQLLFRPCGSELRIVNQNLYFLSDKYTLYCWPKNGIEYKRIIESKDEVNPIREIATTCIAQKENTIPITLFKPQRANGKKIVLAIGGPNAPVSSSDRVIQLLLGDGYEIIAPAYRGCYQNPYLNHEMGVQDVDDLIAIGNYYKERYGNPLPLVGYSYGGLLTLLTLARSEGVFLCGVSLWGVTSLDKLPLKSMYYFEPSLNEDQKQHILNYGNAVVQAKNIKTPLLLVHGTNDTTSETWEVEAIHKQLLEHKVLSELVLYEGDTHGLKANTKDMLKRMSHFMNKFF